MAYCSEQIGRKLRILSFVATLSVVVIHTNHLEDLREVPLAWWVGRFIAGMQLWAVPFFFMVSGFFFERAFERRNIMQDLPAFLGRKVRTVLLPYLLWGICYGIPAMTGLKIGVALKNGEASDIWAGTVFSQWGSWTFWDSIFGISHAPLIGALWYLRVLIIVFATAPLWLFLVRRFRWLAVCAALAIIAVSPLSGMFEEQFAMPFGGVFRIKINAFGWILAGMCMGGMRFDEAVCGKCASVLCAVAWGVCALAPLPWIFSGGEAPFAANLLRQVSPFFTLAALWGFGDWLSARLPDKLPEVFSLGFWIYCMHHPVAAYVGAMGHAIIGESVAAKCIAQAFAWAVTFAVSAVAGLAAKRYMPKTYGLLCGGR